MQMSDMEKAIAVLNGYKNRVGQSGIERALAKVTAELSDSERIRIENATFEAKNKEVN